MIVHVVVALIPAAAISWILHASRARIGAIDGEGWLFITRVALGLVVLALVPATLTGIAERNRIYVTWHPTHRRKVILSLFLMMLTLAEVVTLGSDGGPVLPVWWIGLLIVAVNSSLAFALSALGMRITLGRFGLGGTSYVPDMHKSPPVDILDAVAVSVAEEPRIVDPCRETE